MKTLDDISISESPRILLWGEPGVGKTVLASTFPGLAIADADNNLHVLKSSWYRENYETPDLIGFETIREETDSRGQVKKATALNKLIDFINAADEHPDVKTIVIDSLTAVQTFAMNLGIEINSAMGRSKTKFHKKKHKILIPTQADYGAEISAFSQLMDNLAALDKSIICIAHEREELTDSGAVSSRTPMLIGSAVRSSVGRWFQEVWYLERGRGKDVSRILRTQSDNKISGLKSAAFSIPDGMVNPTYDKIMKEVEG